VLVVPLRAATGYELSPAKPTPPRVVVDSRGLTAICLAGLLEQPPICAEVAVGRTQDWSTAHVLVIHTEGHDPRQLHTALEVAARPSAPAVLLLVDAPERSQTITALRAGVRGVFSCRTEVAAFTAGVQAILSGQIAIGQDVLELLLSPAPTQDPASAAHLSTSEIDVLGLLTYGRSVLSIAAERGISIKTVRNHTASIYRKLEVHSRTQAIVKAVSLGIVPMAEG